MNKNKTRNRISVAELRELLMAVKGHPFSHWALMTEATLEGGKQVKAQFGGVVYKFATYTIVANRKYDRAVELLAEKLNLDFANWTPQPHLYADHLSGNVLYHRADVNLPIEQRRLYAQFMLHKDCQREAEYYDAQMRPLTIDQVKPYFRDNTSKKQSDFGIAKQDQIPVINPSLNSIRSVSLNGEIYDVFAEL
jgi:hypothetical protein